MNNSCKIDYVKNIYLIIILFPKLVYVYYTDLEIYETDIKNNLHQAAKLLNYTKKVNIFHCVFLRVHKMLVIILERQIKEPFYPDKCL